MKIHIIGGSGTGKSYLANVLSEKYNICPTFIKLGLEMLFHLTSWSTVTPKSLAMALKVSPLFTV